MSENFWKYAIASVMALFMLPSHSQSCIPNFQLTYPDGSKGCLTDLPLAKRTLKTWGKSVSEVVKYASVYSVAASATCQDVQAAASNTSLASVANNQLQVDEAALKACDSRCECFTAIRSGKVSVGKDMIVGFGLSDEERRQQVTKREEDSRKASLTAPTNTDRELLIQLTAEMARLKQQTAEQDKKLNQPLAPAAISVAPEVLVPLPVMANRKALVIGNDRYKFVTPLNSAKEDAKVMAESLRIMGYQVSLKLDVTEKDFKASLRQFRNQVETGDEVAFFFAGHGVQLNNNNFLVPVDVAGESEDQLRDEAIPLQRFLDDMSDKRVKFSLAMIDACRDNPFKSNGRALGGGTRGLAPTTAATGQMVVFSAGAGQQALDKLGPNDNEKNGVFTRVFVREMQKPGLTVDRIVRNTRSEVVNLAKSIGHDQVPAIYDQTVGEFYFRGK